MSNIGKIIRVNTLPPVEERENNVIYQVAAPGAATYTDYAVDENGDIKTHSGNFNLQDLVDSAVTITTQEILDEGIINLAEFNANIRERLDNKLDKPSLNGNSQDYPKVLGLDDNGNTAVLPAEDLIKNIANSTLTSVAGAGLTLGADWGIETAGHQYSISGLNDVSADPEFKTFVSQNDSGKLGKTNGIQPFLSLPNTLNEVEKTKWKTAMNGGWTTNTMSIATVYPNVIKPVTYPIFITITGANLNINPSSAIISFINIRTNSETLINNDQITYRNANEISLWIKPSTLPEGEYKIKIFNGVAITSTSELNNIIIKNIASINMNNFVWERQSHTQTAVDNVLKTNGGVIDFVNDSSNKPLTNDFSVVASAKTNRIFSGTDNFFLKGYITLTADHYYYGGAIVGLMNSDNNLPSDAFLSLKIIANGGNWVGTYKSVNDQPWSSLYGLPSLNQAKIDFMISKRNNLISITLNHNTSYNNTIQVFQTVQKTIPDNTPVALTFKGLNSNSTNVIAKAVIEEAYAF